MLFRSRSVNTGKRITLFNEYDDDLQDLVSDNNKKFANDLGFD